MKKFFIILALLLSLTGVRAQSISHIETTTSWYYLYDQDGRKMKTLSRNIGELQGFSASFFVVRSGAWYHLYNAKGLKTKTLAATYVGEVLSVSGNTFTSRQGSWIYTWSIDGKKIATRPAR